MKDLSKELAVVLQTAEASVLDIVARAAAEGDYAMIDRARSLAERLRALNTAELPRRAVTKAKPARQKRRTGGKRKPKANGAYPKFTVENGSLYKIGWSKKKGTEYTHRISVSAALEVVAALDQLSEKVSGVVSAEKIISSEEFQMAAVADYQVYLILALLKREKIIISSGREGYTLPTEIYPQADALLNSLDQSERGNRA